MYTLFLDTHGSEIIVSLFDGVNCFIKRQESEYSHAKFLCPMIDSIMKDNNVLFSDIKEIVVVNGPGSFTGLRIGLSVAKVMSFCLKVPIKTVSSLMACLVSDPLDDKKIAVIEDNKGFYVCVSNEEQYVEDLKDFSEFRIVPDKLDVVKVLEYSKSLEPVDAHLVRANYVKKIEAEK